MDEDQKCWICQDTYEELHACDECGDVLCLTCLSEECEDGYLCPLCLEECLECGASMSISKKRNHRMECTMCGWWTCEYLQPCCSIVCSSNERGCEEKFYDLSQVLQAACCGRRYCMLCEPETMQDHSCQFCDVRACQQDMGKCSLHPEEHHFCKKCSLRFCEVCMCLECPTCEEHTPWACLLSVCSSCVVGILCARHTDDHCSTCGKGYTGAGACPDCRVAIELVLMRVMPGECQAVFPLIRSLLGSRQARRLEQIPNASKRLLAPFQNFQTWARVTALLRDDGYLRILPSLFKQKRSKTLAFASLSVSERDIAEKEVLEVYNDTVPFQKGKQAPKIKAVTWVHAIRAALGRPPCTNDCECETLLVSEKPTKTIVGHILCDRKRRKVG